MINLKNKKAAMEMSMGTIVTIVLLMSVLVLGIFMIQNIFDVSEGAIGAIDDEVSSQITKLFQEGDTEVVILPSSGKISLKDGSEGGFALGISNTDSVDHTYTYTIEASTTYKYDTKCASGMTADKANDFLSETGGEILVEGKGTFMPKSPIFFEIPKGAPSCTIPFKLVIKRDGNIWSPGQETLFVTIK